MVLTNLVDHAVLTILNDINKWSLVGEPLAIWPYEPYIRPGKRQISPWIIPPPTPDTMFLLTQTLGAALSLPKCWVVTFHRGTVHLLTVHCTILKQTVKIISPHILLPYINTIYIELQFNLIIADPYKLVKLLKQWQLKNSNFFFLKQGFLNFVFMSIKTWTI